MTARSATLSLALLAAPGIALAQSPSPLPTGNVPHVRPAPSGTPMHHASPQPGHPTPQPSAHASRPNQSRSTSRAPYSARVNLTGDDVQKILAASPSPSAKPTLGPPKTSFPEPDVFHDTHN